jgi:hypothetical protein
LYQGVEALHNKRQRVKAQEKGILSKLGFVHSLAGVYGKAVQKEIHKLGTQSRTDHPHGPISHPVVAKDLSDEFGGPGQFMQCYIKTLLRNELDGKATIEKEGLITNFNMCMFRMCGISVYFGLYGRYDGYICVFHLSWDENHVP